MKVFGALAVVAALGFAGPAGAAVHKCVAKDGKATWTDKPCTVYAQPGTPQSGAESPQAAPEAAPDPNQPVAAPDSNQPTAAAAASETPSATPGASSGSSSATPGTGSGSATETAPSAEELQQMQEEQAEAMQAEFAKRFKRKAGMLGFAGLLIFIAWIMHIVAAAKLGKVAWAICLFLFSPLSNVPFTILYWDKAKLGFFLYLAGMGLMIGTVWSLYSGLVPT